MPCAVKFHCFCKENPEDLIVDTLIKFFLNSVGVNLQVPALHSNLNYKYQP